MEPGSEPHLAALAAAAAAGSPVAALRGSHFAIAWSFTDATTRDYTVTVDDGTIAVVPGPPAHGARPTVEFRTDTGTAAALAGGELRAQDAISLGRLKLRGDLSLLSHHAEAFFGLSAFARAG